MTTPSPTGASPRPDEPASGPANTSPDTSPNTLANPPTNAQANVLTIALAVALLACSVGWRPLMLPDEGRYVGIALEMVQSGQWAVPTLDGLPFFHKPPLLYWLTAAALAAFGPNEWAARAAPLAGGLLAGAALWLFARRWLGDRTARAALLAWATQPLALLGSQFANMDMLVAGCVAAATLAGADALLRSGAGEDARPAVRLAWFCAALGVLAKGLIGVVLPAAVLATAAVASGRTRHLLRFASPTGALLFGLVALPWFVLMQQRFPGFFDYFIVEQHLQRYASGGFNNVLPWWFYAALLAVAGLAWWPWVWRAMRPPPDRARPDATRAFVRRLAWCWAGVVTVFFSLPASKLVGYILPAVPPLALLAGMGWAQSRAGAAAGRSGAHLAGALSYGATALLALGVAAYLTLHPRASSREFARTIDATGASAPVLSVGYYPYDLGFYRRHAQGIVVIDRWGDDRVRLQDDWRKELADAARFAPPVAHERLKQPADAPALLCAAPSTWIIDAPRAPTEPPPLAALPPQPPALTVAGHRLWRFDRASAVSAGRLHCAP